MVLCVGNSHCGLIPCKRTYIPLHAGESYVFYDVSLIPVP